MLMESFTAGGSLTIAPDALAVIRRTFDADRVDEAETAATIRQTYAALKLLIDPHTAVAMTATRKARADADVVVLATAHPAKFPEAVERATAVKPQLPERLRWILTAPEKYDTLPNDPRALKDHLAARR
jgi:threonine synthase